MDQCAEGEAHAAEVHPEGAEPPVAELVVVDSLGVEAALGEEAATVVAGLSVGVAGAAAVVTSLFMTDLAFWRNLAGLTALLSDEHMHITTRCKG